MSAISTRSLNAPLTARAPRLPLLSQVGVMTWRNLLILRRSPAVVVPSILIGVFFLVIYQSTLGGAAAFLPQLNGSAYIGFILPLSVISAALGGGGIAGENLVRDLESGYFDKLLLTPVSRAALVLGPIIAGGVMLGIQTVAIMAVGLLMGLNPVTGLPGLLAAVGLTMLTGLAFSGFSVGMALRTGSAAATQTASFIFFPLTFLTASFVPMELLEGWLRVAATFNPITYLLEAMRALFNTGWDGGALLAGLVACLLMAVVTFAFALASLRARTARR